MAESVGEKGAEAAPSEDVKGQENQTEVPLNFKAIVLGATGATGRFLVGELLNSKHFQEVTLLGRKKFSELPESFNIDLEKEETSGHLKQIVIDLEEANEENCLKHFEGMDAYFTCLGTTKASAGSNANFRHIDFDYNVKFGEIAKKAGVPFCSLLSSSGAHPRSYIFYLKVKGEIEEAFTKMGFPFLTIFRPGILDRKQHQRFLEKFVGLFMTKMPVDTLAKAILCDAVNQLRKERSEEHRSHILANHQILDLAKMYAKEIEPAKEATGASAEATGASAEATGASIETKPAAEGSEEVKPEGEADVEEDVGNEVDKATDEAEETEKPKGSDSDAKGTEQEQSSEAKKSADEEGSGQK